MARGNCAHVSALGREVPGVAGALRFWESRPGCPEGATPLFCSCWVDGPSCGTEAALGVGESQQVSLLESLGTESQAPAGTVSAIPTTLSLLSTGEMPFPMPGSTSSRSRWMKRSSRGPWRDRLSEGHELRVASPGH